MNDDAIQAQALKAAVQQTRRLAGIGLLLLGSATVGLAMSDSSRIPGTVQGGVWLLVGALLMVFSRLAPPPTSAV